MFSRQFAFCVARITGLDKNPSRFFSYGLCLSLARASYGRSPMTGVPAAGLHMGTWGEAMAGVTRSEKRVVEMGAAATAVVAATAAEVVAVTELPAPHMRRAAPENVFRVRAPVRKQI